MEIRPKPIDIKEEYDAFFPIYSDEEGKKFSSLCKRNICMPKYFDEQLLKDMGVHDFVNLLCKRLGWFKVKTVKYDVFYELMVEFYTTLKIKDDKQRIFLCRFFGNEYEFDYDLLTEIFDFHDGGVCCPPPEFNLIRFWDEITRGDKIGHGDTMISGLIHNHSYLLMHKFIAHTIYGRNESTKVMPDELFLLWCMITNTRVNSAYLVFRSMWHVVQGRKTLMSMGHIITGLAIHFVPRKLTILQPLDKQILDDEFLVKAEIISKFGGLEDVKDRRCYQLRQTALKLGDVPLPKVVENFDDVSEEEEEDVKPQVSHEKERKNVKNSKGNKNKKNKPSKRKRFEDCIDKVEKKIEEVANRSDQMLGDMIKSMITKFEAYETLRDARMGDLIAEVQELNQMISQSIEGKASTEPSVEIIIPETSSSNGSD